MSWWRLGVIIIYPIMLVVVTILWLAFRPNYSWRKIHRNMWNIEI